jgi:hypothetical protein
MESDRRLNVFVERDPRLAPGATSFAWLHAPVHPDDMTASRNQICAARADWFQLSMKCGQKPRKTFKNPTVTISRKQW